MVRQLQFTLLPSIYLGNPDLKWERYKQFDAGVELGLFHATVLT
jgi:outer membrane receptor protein involved in Fe transport